MLLGVALASCRDSKEADCSALRGLVQEVYQSREGGKRTNGEMPTIWRAKAKKARELTFTDKKLASLRDEYASRLEAKAAALADAMDASAGQDASRRARTAKASDTATHKLTETEAAVAEYCGE